MSCLGYWWRTGPVRWLGWPAQFSLRHLHVIAMAGNGAGEQRVKIPRRAAMREWRYGHPAGQRPAGGHGVALRRNGVVAFADQRQDKRGGDTALRSDVQWQSVDRHVADREHGLRGGPDRD